MSEQVKTALVVADKYKLSKHDGDFSEDLKTAKLINKAHLITREYADEMNTMWKSTGIKCVIDEEASTESQEEREADAAKRLKNDKAQELAGRAITSIALG